MGIIHRATLTPSKQEIVEAWLPSRRWAGGRTITEKVAEYRLDDPDGEVGVETILWRTDDGALVQTPLTYRAAPLDGAEAHLITTTQHSVLGERWVYDGCCDPVWAATLTAAILTGGRQSQMFFDTEEGRVDIPARMEVRGSGDSATAPPLPAVRAVTDADDLTVVDTDAGALAIARVVGTSLGEGPHLLGRVGDAAETTVLAVLRRA